MRTVLRVLALASVVVACAHAAWAFGLNPFGRSGLPLTAEDFQVMALAEAPLLSDDSIPLASSRDWSNPSSGNGGTITLQRRFETTFEGNDLPCRTLSYRIRIANRANARNFTLDRCRVADGSWKLLSIGPGAGSHRDGKDRAP
jgi:hypothetical protein